ncbi:HNH endonuclease [Pectobacterium odoriferum]
MMSRSRPSGHIKAQKEVKVREGYMCLRCGGVYEDSHGHHLLYYSEGGPANFHTMTTMCPACHRKYHAKRANIDIIRF